MSDDTSSVERWLGDVPELVAVVAVKQERRARNGGRVVATSVEIWGDRCRWSYAVFPSTLGEHPGDTAPWVQSDDVGTAYTWADGGGGGDGRWVFMSMGFRPGPPAAATTLTLSGGDLAPGQSFVVRLD